jgi:hypothetical protein
MDLIVIADWYAWIIFSWSYCSVSNGGIIKKIVLDIAGIGKCRFGFYGSIMNSRDPDHGSFINPFSSTGTDSV